MKKKSNAKVSALSLVIKASVLILAIAALCMAFMPFVTATAYVAGKAGTPVSLSGFIMGFGKSATFLPTETNYPEWINFVNASDTTVSKDGITYTVNSNVGILITLILVIVGAALALLSLFMNKKSSKKIAGLCLLFAGLCLIAGGIMAFFPVKFGCYESSLPVGGTYKTGVEYTNGIGAILFAIFSLVSGAISSVYGLLNAAK